MPYTKFFTCHFPSSTYGYHHNCSSKCFKNFPLQTCGNVCGAIVAILAVVAQKAPDVWKNGIPDVWKNGILLPTCNLPSSLKWLLDPTTYSDYLREVITSWLVKGQTDVSFIKTMLKKDDVFDEMQDSTPSPPAANVVVSCSISPIKRQ
jgi:hypothetical protein